MDLQDVTVSSGELYRLYRMLYAPAKTKLLLTGIDLKIFNHLSIPKSSEEVAEVIGCHPKNTMLFLNGLAACDLIEKHKGLYQNTHLSEGLTDEVTKPDFHVLWSMGWAMTGPVTAFDQGFIADAMLKAGFRSVRSRTLSTAYGPMDLDIARK